MAGSFDRGSSASVKRSDEEKLLEAMRKMDIGLFGEKGSGGAIPKFITDSKGNTTKLYKKGGLVRKRKGIMLKGRGGSFKGTYSQSRNKTKWHKWRFKKTRALKSS
jgi:hypothetical protein